MELLPANLLDFESYFSTEEQCVEYLVKARWADGFICPRCQHKRSTKKIQCRSGGVVTGKGLVCTKPFLIRHTFVSQVVRTFVSRNKWPLKAAPPSGAECERLLASQVQ